MGVWIGWGGWVDRRTDRWWDEWLDGWMHACIHGWETKTDKQIHRHIDKKQIRI
jgi:hypothetical protein